jgi:hypothetical protein
MALSPVIGGGVWLMVEVVCLLLLHAAIVKAIATEKIKISFFIISVLLCKARMKPVQIGDGQVEKLHSC